MDGIGYFRVGYFLGYFFWYLGIMGTGLYLLSNSIGTRAALPKTRGWQILWNCQIFLGLLLALFPFVHVLVVSHIK